jgi:hypothetical protein
MSNAIIRRDNIAITREHTPQCIFECSHLSMRLDVILFIERRLSASSWVTCDLLLCCIDKIPHEPLLVIRRRDHRSIRDLAQVVHEYTNHHTRIACIRHRRPGELHGNLDAYTPDGELGNFQRNSCNCTVVRQKILRVAKRWRHVVETLAYPKVLVLAPHRHERPSKTSVWHLIAPLLSKKWHPKRSATHPRPSRAVYIKE